MNPSRAEAVPVSRTRRCLAVGCGKKFDVEAYQVDGREVGGPFLCPECRRGEEEREAERLAADRARIRAGRTGSILELLQSAGVATAEHGTSTLDSYDTGRGSAAALEATRAFVDATRRAAAHEPVRGLYLFGGTGTGKTHLAAAACRELLLDPAIPSAGVLFDRSLRLVNRIQDTYNTGESTEEILRRRFEARLWVLDDLGTEQPSADVIRRLTDILQERALRPVLITSNHAPDELEKRDPGFFRIVSRLGPRYFRTVRLTGTDARFEP